MRDVVGQARKKRAQRFFFLTHLSSSVTKTRDLWRYVLLAFMGLQAEALQGATRGRTGTVARERKEINSMKIVRSEK